jgi:hypothetical protein
VAFRAAGLLAWRSLERGSGSAQAPWSRRRAGRDPLRARQGLGERIDVALIGEAAKQTDIAGYVLTDSAVIEALAEASARGVTVRIWRDANMAARVGDFDVEAQLGGGFRASRFDQTRLAPNSCTLRVIASTIGSYEPAPPILAAQARRARTMTSWR